MHQLYVSKEEKVHQVNVWDRGEIDAQWAKSPIFFKLTVYKEFQKHNLIIWFTSH